MSKCCLLISSYRPFCSQCSSGPANCIYPESGKRYEYLHLMSPPSDLLEGAANVYRGLPLGYLNQLEQRLVETESALYGALMTLSSMSPTTVLQATAKPDSVHKPKAARMDEWSQLPLRDWSDMNCWQAAMGDQFTIEQPHKIPFADRSEGSHAMPVSPTVNTRGPQGEGEVRASAIYAWQPREDVHMGSPYETHLLPPGMVSSPVYLRYQASAKSGVTSPDGTKVTGVGESHREADQSTMADELSKSQPSIYF